jgi:GNAT superfamily N-acetyltransferase
MVKYTMEIEIRYLNEKDLDVLEKDIREMWSKHRLNNKSLISEDTLKDTNLHKYFKRSINRQKGFALIAMVGEEIAGIIRVAEEPLEDFFSYKKTFKVDDLVIKTEFRRKGVATALLTKVKEIAKEKGISVLKARIYSFNEPAQNFFIEKGFDPLYGEYFETLD